MKKFVIFLSIITLGYCASIENIHEGRDTKDGRVISLFNVIKFKNDPCPSSSTLMSSGSGSGNRNGTCLTENECSDRSGIAAGGCASGFGVCCVFMISTCGGIVSENCTYVRNPGFPESITDVRTCKFTIQKCDKGVCSLRLDFETFNILGPADTIETDGGACVDSFQASASATGSRTPVICGENAGQHIYVDIGAGDMDQGALDFTLDGTMTTGRQFEIKVSQIFCNSPSRPPDGCLQYLTGTDGTLTSFNFASSTGHLANQDYNICIRQEKGFCCVQYQVCQETGSFTLDLQQEVAADQVSAEDELCKTDYVRIEGSTSTCSLIDTSNRYCSQKLADAKDVKADLEICDCSPPFSVGIKTDATPDALVAGMADSTVVPRGVCLNYYQTACGMNVP